MFVGFADDGCQVINMWVLGLLQVATIYSQKFQQFLAVRALFGLFMGGVCKLLCYPSRLG